MSLWWIIDLFVLPTYPLLALSMLAFKVGRRVLQAGLRELVVDAASTCAAEPGAVQLVS